MERIVDLTQTKNIVINLDSAVEEHAATAVMFGNLGMPFQRFSAIKHNAGPNPYGPHFIGCAKSHLATLKGMRSSCWNRVEQKPMPLMPTCVFEDDLLPTAAFSTRFSVPADTDAVYLGISNHGTIRNNNFGYAGIVMATQETPEFKRVYNMCSTHAMVYLSIDYVLAAEEIIYHYMRKGIACDVALAHIHKDFKILTPNDPYVYQKDQPELTNFSLKV